MPAKENSDLSLKSPPVRPAFGLFMLVMLLAACGGNARQVSGEVPLVSLDGLGLSENTLELDIRIRNINDSSLELPTLTLSLTLDGQYVVQGRRLYPSVVIAARGREVIRMETDLNARGRQLLEELARGDRDSLAYQLDLEFEGRRRRQEDPEVRGFLHAVPGQPGRFR